MIALVRVHFDTSAPWATKVAVVRALGVFVERLSGRVSFCVHCRRKMFLAMMIKGVIFLDDALVLARPTFIINM